MEKFALILEDEPAIRDSLALLLKKDKFTTFSAEEGDALIDILRRLKSEQKKITVAVLDLINHFGKGGIDIIEEIKKIDGSIKTLAVTGYDLQEYQEICKLKGFDGVIEKPFDYKTLRKKIESIGVNLSE
jgi:CheY-like chemotaxis protein